MTGLIVNTPVERPQPDTAAVYPPEKLKGGSSSSALDCLRI